jgi:hypothetical protein
MAKSENSPLTRVTVNLIPRSDAALTLAVKLTGDTKTDTINRALQMYAYLMWIASKPGGRIGIRQAGDEGWTQLLLSDRTGTVTATGEEDEVGQMLSGTGTATRRPSPPLPGRG